MKILRKNEGPLTNFEVLDFLRSRGAASDLMVCLGAVASSECNVFDYLVHSPACNQTRKDVDEFMKRCDAFDLAQAEKLNIVNLRPSNQAEIFPIIEYCDKRFPSNEQDESKVEEIVQLVLEVLPAPPKSEEAETSKMDTELNEEEEEV